MPWHRPLCLVLLNVIESKRPVAFVINKLDELSQWYSASICSLLFAKLPVLSLWAKASSLLQLLVRPTTLMAYISPHLSWLKVQLELVELQVVTVPLLSLADTTCSWSGPEFAQLTVAMFVLHCKFTITLFGLQGAGDKARKINLQMWVVLKVIKWGESRLDKGYNEKFEGIEVYCMNVAAQNLKINIKY